MLKQVQQDIPLFLETAQPLKRYAWNICLDTAKLLTSCVPDGTPPSVGFYPTEALSLMGQETDNATQTA